MTTAESAFFSAAAYAGDIEAMAHKGQPGTRFGKAARTHSFWQTKPPIYKGVTPVNVFLIIAESKDGHRWVETAYKDKMKANTICAAKNKGSTDGNVYTVLHTPVND